ncbi:MAG: FAD-dependent oxidoreductase [Nitrososphaeria archaeon]|nr:FAD-dependent oxidoreductase [Nitrososphaeria archaeon]
MEEFYDVIIVGGGAAGLSAGIYACRRKMSTLIITKDIGGQALMAKEIENYPGVEKVSGLELVQKMYEQALGFGAQVIQDEVKLVEKVGEGHFRVKTLKGEYVSRSVIIAAGKVPRDLKVPGEERFKGSGVSYCATCDAPLYRNKRVMVVGDGNFALDAALLLAKYASEVNLITKKSALTGDRELVEMVLASPSIKVFYGTVVKEIKGSFKVDAIVLESHDRGVYTIPVDGVFVEMGYEVNIEPFKDIITFDERKQIKVNNRNETSTSGVFACGDITNTPYKQLVISAAEGAKAALSAYEYVQRLSGKHAVTIDWHK